MINVGVDIEEISRFKDLRFPDRAAELFLTPAEIAGIQSQLHKPQYLASRFAVKEAVIKALPEKAYYHDFEIVKDGVKPKVSFINDKLKKYKISISLAHSRSSAIGFAVLDN
jgi:holo-[acyl-carrier protein] synthase